jgi:hypothetical protein
MDTTVVKRLAFIKCLFELGLAQSQLPEPASSTSVLMFHDAIELFNHLACEYHDIDTAGKGSKQIEFMGYWDLISSKLGKPLPQKESMKRLNRSRVDLKHHGIFPSKLDIESFRGTTNFFFSESTPLVFRVEFTEISLIDFVAEERAQQNLHDAVQLLGKGDLDSALKSVADAFHHLIEDYETRKRSEFGRSPFSFGPSFIIQNSLLPTFGYSHQERTDADKQFHRNLEKFVQAAAESLNKMHNAIFVLALGIDYPKYTKYSLIAPIVQISGSGMSALSRRPDDEIISAADVQFCIDFVIETALKLQEFDYTISKPNSLR